MTMQDEVTVTQAALNNRSPLHRAVYKAIRNFDMGNMCDEDGYPYPLVDLMSNPAPADISTGEYQMIGLTDEIVEAIQAERETLARMEPVAFQKGVDQWMDVCFGEAIKADKVERCDRFIEEALEFVQSVGYSAERAHALVDYVFNRDIGEVNQEVGGVMVTLAAACNTIGVDIASAAQTELARVWTKVDAIRAKQAAKPTGSALPIALPPAPEAGQ